MTEPYRLTKQAVPTMTSKSMVLDIIDRLVELFGLDTPEELEATCRENAPVVFMMSGEQAEQKFVYEFAETKHPLTRHQLGLVSYVYCLRSLEATLNQQPNEAWIYQSFAHYWLGVTVGAQAAEGAAELSRKLLGSKGGNKGHEGRHALKEYAVQRAKTEWFESQPKAATQIYEDFKKIAEEQGIKGYELKNPERTISGYLAGIDVKKNPKL